MSAKRKPMTNTRTVIRCGTEDDAKLAYLAMFRYAFGCQTYMPGVVIEIIKSNSNHLTMSTLYLLNRELTEEAGRYERIYKDRGKPYSNYGMDCDRRAWLDFHEWVKAEIAKREAGDE